MAFVLALINLARRAASPVVDLLAADGAPQDSLLSTAPHGAVTAPGVLVLRMAAPLFFANASVFVDRVKVAVQQAGGSAAVRHVVLDLGAVSDVDVTAAEAFAGLREWADAQELEVSFSRVRPGSEARFRRFGIITEETVFPTNRAALAALAHPSPTKVSP